ncbi:MAG TPA: heavy metal-associated domain-containing protein [Mariprofundaceae bacterium]|nr:heavy metal-associated domain-containing protein [Mariprofundaceae bacterium]
MKPANQEPKHISIRLLGMMCDGCEATIRKRFLKLDGVDDARANHKTGELHLYVYPADFSMTKANHALKELGYTVKRGSSSSDG